MKISAFSKKYDERFTLSFPGAELENGRIYSILGENGSGKSTFAKVISGWLKADGTDAPLRNINVGYLPQKTHGFRMSVRSNILLGGEDTQKASELMEMLGLDQLEKEHGRRLSGGETAKMCLARVLAGKHELLVLDEPFAAMDVKSVPSAERLIRKYVSEHDCPAVVITHDRAQAERISDEIWFFENGKLTGKKGSADDGSRFFCNKECKYFPCHTDADPERFNCIFCYCPLYGLGKECGGNFTYLENGVKDCSGCVIPHIPGNYPLIVEKIKEAGII